MLRNKHTQWSGAIFISLSQAPLWTPQVEHGLFGNPSRHTCYSNINYGFYNLFDKLEMPFQLVAGVFGTACFWKSLWAYMSLWVISRTHAFVNMFKILVQSCFSLLLSSVELVIGLTSLNSIQDELQKPICLNHKLAPMWPNPVHFLVYTMSLDVCTCSFSFPSCVQLFSGLFQACEPTVSAIISQFGLISL